MSKNVSDCRSHENYSIVFMAAVYANLSLCYFFNRRWTNWRRYCKTDDPFIMLCLFCDVPSNQKTVTDHPPVTSSRSLGDMTSRGPPVVDWLSLIAAFNGASPLNARPDRLTDRRMDWYTVARKMNPLCSIADVSKTPDWFIRLWFWSKINGHRHSIVAVNLNR